MLDTVKYMSNSVVVVVIVIVVVVLVVVVDVVGHVYLFIDADEHA